MYHQPDINKIYLYSKDLYKPKYQLLIKNCESACQKHSNDPKTFIKYSNVMEDINENSDEWSYMMIWYHIWWLTKNLTNSHRSIY